MKTNQANALAKAFCKVPFGNKTVRFRILLRLSRGVTLFLSILNNWIWPSWGMLDIHAVRTVEIERWLGEQKRPDGSALANSSNAKIRSVFCVLFNHAIRNKWIEQEKNPALFDRQSAKRHRAPDILEPKELQALRAQFETSFRLVVLMACTTGLAVRKTSRLIPS